MTDPKAGPLGKAAAEQLKQGVLPRLLSSSEVTCSTRRAKLASLREGDAFQQCAATLPGLISRFIYVGWV